MERFLRLSEKLTGLLAKSAWSTFFLVLVLAVPVEMIDERWGWWCMTTVICTFCVGAFCGGTNLLIGRELYYGWRDGEWDMYYPWPG